MWVRKRFDIGWSDLAYGIGRALLPVNRRATQRRIEARWSDSGKGLACLSVRSGFDLLLQTLALPRGSEVLMSAMTIRQMVDIVEHHGLVPVPIDIDPETLAPRVDLLEGAITPKTRAVVVAHLFGSRVPMDPIVDLAAQRGLLVIEDCAQAFVGPGYVGDRRADVSMFSFGSIKTATALGAALFTVREDRLLKPMRQTQSAYSVQSRWSYLYRLVKYAGMKALSLRLGYRAVLLVCRMVGCDYDRFVNGTARGFPGPHLLTQIRRQPPESLLAVLERRLRRFNKRRLGERVSKAELLIELLGGRLERPGQAASHHWHWVFPIVVENPQATIAALREAGFDATQGQSLSVIPAPRDRPELEPKAAGQLLSKVVFLPFYPEIPRESIRQMATVLLERDPAAEARDQLAGSRDDRPNLPPFAEEQGADGKPAGSVARAPRN